MNRTAKKLFRVNFRNMHGFFKKYMRQGLKKEKIHLKNVYLKFF